MRLFFAVSVSYALATSTARAQDITPPPAPIVAPAPSADPEFTLRTLVNRALESSPRLQIARENLAAATGRAQSSRAPLGPTLQLVPGFFGTDQARDDQIILAQPLDVFGVRRAEARVSAAEVRRAEAERRLAVRTLEIEVKVAAAQLFAAQEAEKLEQVQVEIARLFLDAATKRANLGDVPPVHAQRAELELLRLENDLANARAERLTRHTALNTLIGAAPNAPLRVSLPLDARATTLLRAPLETVAPDVVASQAAALETATLEVFAPDVAVSQAVAPEVATTETTAPEIRAPATSAGVAGEFVAPDLTIRPDLAGAQATLEARQAQVQALGRARLPQFELQLRRAPFFGRSGSSTALRAFLTVPLFDFGALKGQRRANRSQRPESNPRTVHLRTRGEHCES